MYLAPSETVWLSVTSEEDSNLAVIYTKQAVDIDESSVTIAETFPLNTNHQGH